MYGRYNREPHLVDGFASKPVPERYGNGRVKADIREEIRKHGLLAVLSAVAITYDDWSSDYLSEDKQFNNLLHDGIANLWDCIHDLEAAYEQYIDEQLRQNLITE